jgi:tRNA pseudouridine13 synthase|eukprot:COSAG06_NODE_30366_length_540_cov_0.705215_1_plen_165_part_01
MVYSKVEDVARVYEQSISADGIKFDKDQGGGGGPVVSLPGSYRRVLQRVDDLTAKRIGYTHDDEQLYVTDYDAALGRVDGVKENGDPDAGLPYTAVQLSFTLPRSCYATMLLRELTKGDSSTHAQRAKTQAMQADTAQAAATAAATAGAVNIDPQAEATQPVAK